MDLTDVVQNFKKAIAERNYSGSMHLLDTALHEASILELATKLEEVEQAVPLQTLEFRDHIFYYLNMWDIYFAVQIPSIEVLKLLHENNVVNNSQVFMIDFIRDLLDSENSQFNQYSVDVETISRGQYAILLPSLLERRARELENCKIQYLRGPPSLYCTADLMNTYYGRKIVSATHKVRNFDIVVNAKLFGTIDKSLSSAGLDVTSMLEEIEPDIWEFLLARKKSPRQRQNGPSELIVLNRVKSARSNIFAENYRQQLAALNAITLSKTQRCNDVLTEVVSDENSRLRRRSLRQLGETGDSSTLDFLAGIMKNDGDEAIRTEAARAFSSLTSRSKLSSVQYEIRPVPAKPPLLDLLEINRILNTLVAKGMPTTMIDDTLNAIAIQGGSDAIDILTSLLAKPQTSVRIAVVKASRSLDIDSAASIVRAALDDDSRDVVALAEMELDSRWPDTVWD